MERMCNFFLTVVFVLQVWSSLTYGKVASNDFLVCKPIGSLFELQQSSARNNSPFGGIQGPPGQRGPRGFRGGSGPKGPVGPKATIDWNRIEQTIDRKIKELSQCPGVSFNGSCYWLPQTIVWEKHGKGKAAAESLCRFHNGTLVDIESEEMYLALYKYIQRAWGLYIDRPLDDVVRVWLASTYVNNVLQSSTGGRLYAHWLPGNPIGGAGVIWAVAIDSRRSFANAGMWTNPDLSYNSAVAFCRLNITPQSL